MSRGYLRHQSNIRSSRSLPGQVVDADEVDVVGSRLCQPVLRPTEGVSVLQAGRVGRAGRANLDTGEKVKLPSFKIRVHDFESSNVVSLFFVL